MNSFSWRRALSYLWDVQVDYRSSDINGDLIVFLSKGKFQLCTANAIYSYEDRYDNFANIFRHYLDLLRLPNNRVLILGLGLGSVPIILDKLKPKEWEFTAVEIDETVCELAAEYGYPKIVSPIHTLVMDAVMYLQSCTVTFDLICIDLFIDDVMPEGSTSLDFLKNVSRCLVPTGVVVANTLAFSDKHKIHSKIFFEEKFKKVFPQSSLVHTHLNYMLVSNCDYLINKPTI